MEVSKKILNEIADTLESGEKCFIHKETFEIVTFPDEDQFLDTDLLHETWSEEIKKVDNDKNYIEIERMDSRDSFKVMEDFANALENRSMKIVLLSVLEGKKPFANFKHQIENSAQYRELWFAFRRQKNIEWIENQLNFVVN